MTSVLCAVNILKDKKTRKPFGSAYVWFACSEEADLAAKEMNGKVLETDMDFLYFGNLGVRGYLIIYPKYKPQYLILSQFLDGRFISVRITIPGSCKIPVKGTPYKF